MKTRDQRLLEEAYAKIYTNKYCSQLNQLVEAEMRIVDELIEEAFSDIIQKTGQFLKGGYEAAKQLVRETLSTGAANSILGLLRQKVPVQTIAEGFTNIIIGEAGNTKEAFESFLKSEVQESFSYTPDIVSTFFTESNIRRTLFTLNDNGLLLEQQNDPQAIDNLAKAIAGRIKQMYPNGAYSSETVNQLDSVVRTQLGLPQKSLPTRQRGGGIVKMLVNFIQTKIGKVFLAGGVSVVVFVVMKLAPHLDFATLLGAWKSQAAIGVLSSTGIGFLTHIASVLNRVNTEKPFLKVLKIIFKTLDLKKIVSTAFAGAVIGISAGAFMAGAKDLLEKIDFKMFIPDFLLRMVPSVPESVKEFLSNKSVVLEDKFDELKKYLTPFISGALTTAKEVGKEIGKQISSASSVAAAGAAGNLMGRTQPQPTAGISRPQPTGPAR